MLDPLLNSTMLVLLGAFCMVSALIGAGIYGACLVIKRRRRDERIDWEDGLTFPDHPAVPTEKAYFR